MLPGQGGSCYVVNTRGDNSITKLHISHAADRWDMNLSCRCETWSDNMSQPETTASVGAQALLPVCRDLKLSGQHMAT